MLVKCLVCGGSYKVIHKNHLKTHGLTKQEYLKRFPNAEMGHVHTSVGWSTVEKVCIDCGKPFRAYTCHTNRDVHPKRRCDSCEQRHREGYYRRRYSLLRARARARWRLWGKYRREVPQT